MTEKKLGFGEQFNVRLSRKKLTANDPSMYGMHTNDLLDLEMETLLQGRYFLEGMNFYIKYNFLLENMTSLSGPNFIFAVLKEN